MSGIKFPGGVSLLRLSVTALSFVPRCNILHCPLSTLHHLVPYEKKPVQVTLKDMFTYWLHWT